MNNYLKLADNEFQKLLLTMKMPEKESLKRLLLRETALETEQLKRYQEMLKFAAEQKNNLEYCKHEERIKENELHIEKLMRKLIICDKEININSDHKKLEFANGPIIPAQHSNNYLSQRKSTPNFNTNNANSFLTKPDKKSLIENSERKSVNSKQSIPNIQITNHNPSTNKLSSLKINSLKPTTKQEETPVLFTDIKLRKVGLPPDGKEMDQVNDSKSLLSRNSPIQNGKIIMSNGVGVVHRHSIADPSSQCTKNKFHNPNKDIQMAIQNELKVVQLKKTNVTEPACVMNCSVDNMSLGRYKFSNETSVNNSVSVGSSSINIRKSMPFLNSISEHLNDTDVTDNDSTSNVTVNGTEIGNRNEISTNNFELSSNKNWSPENVLKELYNSTKELNEIHYPSRHNSKSMFGFFDMLPALSNNSSNANLWKRRYASISNGKLQIFENQFNQSALNTFEIKDIKLEKIKELSVELHDIKGLHSTIKFSSESNCVQWLDAVKSQLSHKNTEIIPRIYDAINCNDVQKILIMDIGSCSIRAGLLKSEPTLPKIYFPNIVAISKETKNVVEIGMEAVTLNCVNECNVIRPFRPDTTIEDVAFTSGSVEFTFKKISSMLSIDPKQYVIMLSLPHNVAEVTRTKLADILLLRLQFQGVSMYGQSLLSLHAYGSPTGVLVDIGHRTEVLPVIHGTVQSSAVMRSIYGGHLSQVALSHLLPFDLKSLTDSLLGRYIMENVCFVAENSEDALKSNKSIKINLEKFNLPPQIPNSLSIPGKDRCLPVEGLFNPDIYSLDIPSLPKLIYKSIQNCPMDNRRDLYQSICLSGAATLFENLSDRLEKELRLLVPKNCEVKVHSSPSRAHFSYVGACFVALSDGFSNTVVKRREWEDSRTTALKKWHF